VSDEAWISILIAIVAGSFTLLGTIFMKKRKKTGKTWLHIQIG